MADLRITQLPPLAGADVEAVADLLAVADVSASETKKVKVSDAVAASVTSIPDGTIPGSKLVADSVTAAQIGPNAVGASELADNAVDAAAIQTGVVSGSALPTPHSHILALSIGSGDIADDQVISRLIADNAIQAPHIGDGQVSGSAGALANNHIEAKSIGSGDLADGAVGALQLGTDSVGATHIQAGQVSGSAGGGKDHIADGSIGTTDLADASVTNSKVASGIDGGKLQDLSVSNAKLSGSIAASKLADTTAPAQFIAGPTTGGGAVSARVIVGDDLPAATPTDRGAVTIGFAQGLRLNGPALEIDNDITPSNNYGLVQVSDKGLATAFKPLEPADLPVANNTAIGGVSVPGPALTVSGAGAITHLPSGVTAGTYPKVTVDERGHVTAGAPLTGGDIPNLDASKINTGTFDTARIGLRSLTNDKFANYATTLIQEAEPAGFDYYTGQFWYKESDAQLRTWSGNSWIPVGFGRLSNENLRFCGTFDAATGTVDQITTFGNNAGLVAGQAVPAAADVLTGVYLVCTTPGSFNGQTYDNGDWTLCLGTAQGWQRVDTLNGGGTVTIKISDLLDTTITTPATGDTLIFDAATMKWVNKPTAAQKASFVEAFDGTRTSFTLTRDAGNVNNLLISLGGIIQEPGTDFTFTAPRTVNFVAPPPVGIDYWVLIEGVASTGGGGGGGGGGTSLPDGTAAEEYLKWSAALNSWQPASVLDGGLY